MLRVWNLSLLCATFCLTILGTFLTRSGVLESVHAFTECAIGPWLLAFFGLIVAVTLGLIGWRGDRLRSPGRIDSPLSREGAFLANNVLFAGVRVRRAARAPCSRSSSRRSTATSSRSARPYFERMTMPIGLALLFLMAVAPVLPWRKASGELLRSACSGRRGRARRRSSWPCCSAPAGLAPAAGVRPRRVRRGRRAAPARAGHPAPGLAGPRRPHQRRHGRAPRRGADRRGPRGVEQLRHRARADAGRRRQRHRGRPRDHLPGPAHRRGAQQDVDPGPRPASTAQVYEPAINRFHERRAGDRDAVGRHLPARGRLPRAAPGARRRRRRPHRACG